MDRKGKQDLRRRPGAFSKLERRRKARGTLREDRVTHSLKMNNGNHMQSLSHVSSAKQNAFNAAAVSVMQLLYTERV